MKTQTQTKVEVKNVVLERPPVVAVLGHVDHGKTSLLDAIRQTKLAEKEFGGITQHIGAYQIEFKGKKMTFIDTPGHEAFSKMRARGAQATDIALLVVAADDGVMPQTKESIAHIKAANVPIIVAINKIDLPGADINKVKQQLAENEVLVEEYGGEVVAVPVSAKTKQGIDEILEMINLVAEIHELKTNLSSLAKGVVIESSLDKFKGPLASILVKEGTFKVGDQIRVGESLGKIKAMVNDKGISVRTAEPSDPVEILGLETVPAVGEILTLTHGEVEIMKKEERLVERRGFKVEEEGVVRIILKTDASGTLESIANVIENISTDKRIKFLLKETGDINESDVLLASAAKAIIIGFNVKLAPNVKKLTEEEKVFIKVYNVIYDLLDDLKKGLELKRVVKEIVSGKAKIVALFDSKAGRVAGCKVEEGSLVLGDKVRILREGRELGVGKIKSIRHGTESIDKAKAQEECGIVLSEKIDFAISDIMEAFKT